MLEADDGTVLDARGETIGVATNNVAEYSALIAGLQAALERGVGEVEVVSDSELLVKQMRGEYKVKNEALRELVDRPRRWRAGSARSGTPPCAASTTSLPTASSTKRWIQPPEVAAILFAFADVAQLARASACHAEGRGFESHHPLLTKAPLKVGFSYSSRLSRRSLRPR